MTTNTKTMSLSIDDGNQVYLNPDLYTVYSWTRESGEPAASFEGRDRLILCTPNNVDPICLAQWLSEHREEIDDIIALYNNNRWNNEHDETALAVKRLQDKFNEALTYGDIDFTDAGLLGPPLAPRVTLSHLVGGESERKMEVTIGVVTTYIGNEFSFMKNSKVKIVAILKSSDADPYEDAYIDNDFQLFKMGGVSAEDRVEVQPWIEKEKRFSFATSDPIATDLECFKHLK